MDGIVIKKTLKLPTKPESPKQVTIADLERKAIEDSRKYIEAKLEDFAMIRRASGFQD